MAYMKTVVTMNNNNYEIIVVRNKYEAIAIILEKGYSFSDENFFCCNAEGLQEAGPIGPAHAEMVKLMGIRA